MIEINKVVKYRVKYELKRSKKYLNIYKVVEIVEVIAVHKKSIKHALSCHSYTFIHVLILKSILENSSRLCRVSTNRPN